MKRTGLRAVLALAACLGSYAADTPADRVYAALRANDLRALNQLLDQGVSTNTADARQVTALMTAAEIGSVDAMRVLIARGANVNAQNAAGSTALMWSVSDPAKVRLLLEHGGDVNLAAKSGRTALILAAFTSPSSELVAMLLEKGANVNAADGRRWTALNAACFANDTAAIRLLVNAGADVNVADSFIEWTPLMNASGNGNLEAVKLLLAKGANVNAMSKREDLPPVRHGVVAFGGFTPLLTAAAFAPTEVVKTLLDAGAQVNVADVRGFTPLMLAIGTDRQNPQTVELLLKHGADRKARNLDGENASDWTTKIGVPIDASGPAIGLKGGVSIRAQTLPLHTAVERSVGLLEKSAAQFFTAAGCFACHEQTAADFAVTTARAKGITVDEKAAAERRTQTVGLNPTGPTALEGPGLLGGADNALYAAEDLVRTGFTPNAQTDYLAANLAMVQSGDGSWRLGGYSRSPMQDSNFSRTAMALRTLKTFGTPGRAAEMKARIERAKQWLLHTEPVILEDRDMALEGVFAAGASADELKRLAAPILSAQRADGGWAQKTRFASDAYATGMTLSILAETGLLKPDDAAYQMAVRFLLSTQAADGSWHVATRATKFQPYFQSGFPYEHDQWISTMATGWAANALALALEAPVTRAAAR